MCLLDVFCVCAAFFLLLLICLLFINITINDYVSMFDAARAAHQRETLLSRLNQNEIKFTLLLEHEL